MDVATNSALLPIVIDAHYFECVYQKEQQPIFINKHYRILLRILLSTGASPVLLSSDSE